MDASHITPQMARNAGAIAWRRSKWGGQLHSVMLSHHLADELIRRGMDAEAASAFAMDCVDGADGANTHGAGAFGSWVAWRIEQAQAQ